MSSLADTQNSHLDDSHVVGGAIASNSANTTDRDTEHSFATLRQDDLAEVTAIEEPNDQFSGLWLILVIASIGYLLYRRMPRMKTRRRGRSYR